MRNVTLKQLRSVAAILKTGRIVGAAKDLNLTTPAITSQLKLLEEALGASLFDRTRTGMRPTAAGWEVFRTASRIEDLLHECRERLDDLKGLRGGMVSVGVVSTGKYFAPRLMAAFMRDHPQVEIKMDVGNRDAIVEALGSYAVDLAIMGRPPRDFEVEAVPVGPNPLVVIAPPGHRLASERRVGLKALAGERFLIREEGSGTRAAFDTVFTEVAAAGTRSASEFESNETIKQAVMAGLGIALVSGDAIAAELADRRLVTLDVVGLPIMRQWFVIRRSDRTLSAAAGAFYAFLRDSGAAFLPSAGLIAAAESAA